MFGEPAHTNAAGGSWIGTLADGAPARLVERRFGAGLTVAALTPAAVVTRVLTSAGILLVGVLAAVTALTAMGLLPLSPVWLVVPVIAAWEPSPSCGHRFQDRSSGELRRASNDYAARPSASPPMTSKKRCAALGVGSSPAFDALRDELLTAPQRGIPLWEALDSFGRRYEVRELCEFATSLERQGLQGVSIGETVATLASAMRDKALDELEREADRANANLSGPTIGFVVSTIVFLAYPLAQRISDAFGG
jgi:hypothetical protein